MCNTSLASILYCIVQCINYIYLALIPWETHDTACRWRGYFGYMAIAAVVYSYLAQAVSRFLNCIMSAKYHWAVLYKTHLILICIQWLIVLIIPLPTVLTEDIYYRPYSLCWVPIEYTLHVSYSVVAYYLIPAILIFIIYIYIYFRIKYLQLNISTTTIRGRLNRDLEILYNIIILFVIYTVGAIPTLLYLITGIHVLYEISMVALTFTVAVEKVVTLLLDHDIRSIILHYFRRSMIQIQTVT
ncbi:unnamed protein product [Adineta ricciae]|uniref:G-protein coupled receptors family 1 profile domain-containing protein n=1 Tax=Adineta ricciae TaxID=249248 RepID=A0A815SS53_ADIRI|nr:unnamed protein product [Adineta ricciae]